VTAIRYSSQKNPDALRRQIPFPAEKAAAASSLWAQA